jgi:hypothetical protein
MGARQKLNSAYLMGNFILAVLVGGATGSFLVGLVVFALGVIGSLVAGEIRPGLADPGAGPTGKVGQARGRGATKRSAR